MDKNVKKRRDKGEGSWTQNENRSWTYRLGYGVKADGKRKTHTVTAATKEECRQLMRAKKREWDRQNECGVELKNETLTGMCKRYTASKKMENTSRDREECTIRNQLEPYPLGRMQVQAIKPVDVEDHIVRLVDGGELSASSIDKVLDLICAAYNWAVARRELEYNPVLAIKKELQGRIKTLSEKGSDDPDVIVLSADEIKRLREAALEIWKKAKTFRRPTAVYCLLLLYTGMRCGEMISLRWKDIDFENRIITIDSTLKTINNRKGKMVDGAMPKQVTEEGKTKNKKSRNIVMNDAAMEVLRLIRSKVPDAKMSDYVAVTRKGKPYTVKQMCNRMATLFKGAGMSQYKYSCHVLRRTFATDMVLVKEVDTKVVAEYIGDEEATLKKHYLAARKKTTTSDGKEIAVVDPFGYLDSKKDTAPKEGSTE